MMLREVLKKIDYEAFNDQQDSVISNIHYDSRMINKNGCFIAVKGFQQDGHHYIDQAIANGAITVVLTDKSYIKNNNITYILVSDIRQTMAQIAINFYKSPSDNLRLIGVTGTNGKTSITTMLKEMLSSINRKTGVIGTISNSINDIIYESKNTTPEALELNRLFKQMNERSVDICMMEVSSHAIALDRVYGVDYNVAIFTNLSEEHMDFHKDMEDYFLTKARLFGMTSDGNVINIDDKYGKRIAKGFDNCLTYAINNEADLKPDHIKYYSYKTEITLTLRNEKINFEIPLLGDVYVYNFLACIGALVVLNYSNEEIIQAASNIKPVDGRLERVDIDQPFNVIVDYAHSPDALDNILRIIKQFNEGRLITVFGCGGDRDATKRPIMGKIASVHSDVVIVTSDNPRTEDPDVIIQQVQAGLLKGTTAYIQTDRKKAIWHALSIANENDTIVIAGKGHETYQILGKEKIDFDDRKVVKEYFERI